MKHHTFIIHIGSETGLHLFHCASFYHMYGYNFAQKCVAHISNKEIGKQSFSPCVLLITKVLTLLECDRDGDIARILSFHILL